MSTPSSSAPTGCRSPPTRCFTTCVESPGGRMRMCDLAEQAQLSRSGLTRLADRLEKEGLLERCSCEHDARGAYACLTELGRERLGAARGTHLAVVREQFLSRFSEDELGALAELWDRIAPCAAAAGCGVPRRSTVSP